MISVEAAGGVVYRRQNERLQVLLIYRNNTWDLPKGKKEEGENYKECGRREVAEEVGIPLPDIEHFLVETYHQYQRNGKTYDKTTHWFLMRTDVKDNFTPQKEEGIECVQWVDIGEAEQKVGYTNLKKVLQSFRNFIK